MGLLVALGVIMYVTNDGGKTTDELEDRRLVEDRNPAELKAEREVVIEEALKVLGPGKTPDPSDLQKVDQENLLLAAEGGDPRAQYLMGQMYRNGYGVAKDEAEAVKWFRKAADQDDARAQYNLGVRYYFGKGVAKDKEKARLWLTKAAKNGDETAKKALLELGLKKK